MMRNPMFACTIFALFVLMTFTRDAHAQATATDTDSGVDTGSTTHALTAETPVTKGDAVDDGSVVNSDATNTPDTMTTEPTQAPTHSVQANAPKAAPTSTQTETVPEAVEGDGEARLEPYVGIQPSIVKNPNVSGNRGKILTGTWTKSILFSTDDGSFKFQPRGWIQPRFTLSVNTNEDHNDDEPLDGTGFALQRARFGFQAWLFKWGHFYLDTEWKSGSGSLVDYFVDLGPNNGEYPIGVRVGYFRPFFSRQLLHGTTQLAMIDYARAWTALDMTSTADDTQPGGFSYAAVPLMGRQLGIAVQGLVANGFEYGVGIWNGSDGYTADADFMYGGRIAFHPMGFGGGPVLRAGDESDTEVSAKPGLAVGFAAYVEDRNDAVADLPGMLPYEDFKLRAGADLAFKFAGVSLEAEFFLVTDWAKQEADNAALKEYHRDAPGMGTYFQAAYMVVPKRFEVVGRFDMADENIAIRGIRFYPAAELTYYLFGNNLKAQFQYRANFGTGYDEAVDAIYTPVTHDVMFLLQASI